MRHAPWRLVAAAATVSIAAVSATMGGSGAHTQDDEAAVMSALMTGRIDAAIVATDSAGEVQTPSLGIVPLGGQVTRLVLTDHLGESIPLGDVRVRQAIDMVFDKQAMAEAFYLGDAEPTAQVLGGGSEAYIQGLEDPNPYDVERAQALMAEAGYADGFELQIPTVEGQGYELFMWYIRQQLGLLDIDVEPVPLTGANAISDLLSDTYPVVLWQLGTSGRSASQILIEDFQDGWWDPMHQPDEYVGSRYEQLAFADAQTSARLQQEIDR